MRERLGIATTIAHGYPGDAPLSAGFRRRGRSVAWRGHRRGGQNRKPSTKTLPPPWAATVGAICATVPPNPCRAAVCPRARAAPPLAAGAPVRARRLRRDRRPRTTVATPQPAELSILRRHSARDAHKRRPRPDPRSPAPSARSERRGARPHRRLHPRLAGRRRTRRLRPDLDRARPARHGPRPAPPRSSKKSKASPAPAKPLAAHAPTPRAHPQTAAEVRTSPLRTGERDGSGVVVR